MNQNARNSLIARQVIWRTLTLEDLERFLSHGALSHGGLAPTAEVVSS
jgi:hypothetical protein